MLQEHGKFGRNDIDDRIALVATLNEVPPFHTHNIIHAYSQGQLQGDSTNWCGVLTLLFSRICECSFRTPIAQVNRLGRDPQRTSQQHREHTEQSFRSVEKAQETIQDVSRLYVSKLYLYLVISVQNHTHYLTCPPPIHLDSFRRCDAGVFVRLCRLTFLRTPHAIHVNTNTQHTRTHTGRRMYQQKCLHAA